jgi:hypothetical protein
MTTEATIGPKKRTLRRQQKNNLIKEAQQDIDNIEKRLEDKTLGIKTRKGLNVLLDILYVHCQELINSEV